MTEPQIAATPPTIEQRLEQLEWLARAGGPSLADQIAQQVTSRITDTVTDAGRHSRRRPPGPVPTVAQKVPTVLAEIENEGSRRRARTPLKRIIDWEPCLDPLANGKPRDPARCAELECDHRKMGEVAVDEFAEQREWLRKFPRACRALAVANKRQQLTRRKLARLQAREPHLTVDQVALIDDELPLGCGNGAYESAREGLRLLFGHLEDIGWIDASPIKIIKRARKVPTPRRSLVKHEVDQVTQVAALVSHDPALDELLVWFHLETGARVSEALRLRLDDIDPDLQLLHLGQKGGHARWQPVSLKLIEALVEHAYSRGATDIDDKVFWQFKNQRWEPLSEHHYGTFWANVRRHCHWAAMTNASNHCLRKTAGTAVERTAGYQVSETFMGHYAMDNNRKYTLASTEEVALAVELLTGEAHPLASDRAIWRPPGYIPKRQRPTGS
jgi:integrase